MSDKPQLWVIAGPNGSGKSSLVRHFFKTRLPIVNPDDIAREHPGLGAIGAGKKAIALQLHHLEQRSSFVWETTLSGNRELGFMATAKAAGYKVNLVFVCVHAPTVSIFRVSDRVAAGGHDVPQPDIVRRYTRSLENLFGALSIADRAFVLDNSGEAPRLLLSRENNHNRHVSPKQPAWFSATAAKLSLNT